MARLCEGRVAIVTGGARGVGREHCLMLAEHGAKVVVNDLGGDRAGKGNDVGPAQQVVNEIKAKGGEAVANGDDVSDWNGAKRMIDQAVSAFGKLDARGAECRHPARPHAGQYERGRVGRRHQGASQGHLRAGAARRRLLARPGQGEGRPGRCAHRHHHLGVGHLRQYRPDQLRRGQGGHRRLHDHRGARAGALRRHGELDLAVGLHAHDRGPARVQRRGQEEARSEMDRARSRPGW